ncbi:MAG: ABC transporter permease subunit [Alphaproteobacteria bacterium]|nr:ABC transporter permease subunit [Alphaproteobacteria bacterium]
MSSLSSDRVARALSGVCLALSVALLLGVLGGLLWGTLPHGGHAPTAAELASFTPSEQAALRAVTEARPGLGELLLGGSWAPDDPTQPRFGARGMLQASLLVSLGALAFAGPLGLGMAAWLVVGASAQLRAWVRPMLELLAGVPTVVLGFIAVALLAPRLSQQPGGAQGLSGLNGALLLAFMALPTITALATRALESVPEQRVRAAMALGADRWQTLTQVRLPGAAAGLSAAPGPGARAGRDDDRADGLRQRAGAELEPARPGPHPHGHPGAGGEAHLPRRRAPPGALRARPAALRGHLRREPGRGAALRAAGGALVSPRDRWVFGALGLAQRA